MYNIQTLNKIAACGTDLLDKSKYAFGDDVKNPDAILVRSAAMHDMELGSNLLAIARAGAGVNNIPIDKCSERGVVVFNTPGANANAVKELVICGLLLSSRKVPASMNWIQTLKGKGDEVGKLVEKGKSQFVGPEIMGKKLGVIGLGAIGVLVANAAAALGMEVYGADPFLNVDNALKLSGKVHYVKSNKEIFEQCDYITLHVPATAETKGMINAEAISQMKKSVRLLNFSRDALVDENAVINALDNGGMACYVTDFATDALIGHEGVIALPHLGASTPESEDNCAVMAVQEVVDYIENGNIKNSVNLPNMSMPITGDAKICVIHKNAVGVINAVTEPISAAGLNIENSQNKSKKDYAYTCFDVSGNTDGIAEKLKAVENVVGVRVIK
ncbi:MAG: 3-phosphoglycerate dehydrogenase family protein [Lachnospiraceae bacterium]|nr:3-phosphoglycerate dehydrogenase family protein [Ruminococcus sp.]MCM1276113.1 3-phosphoglycerate dehydrogenase family protein [Lachnospiraceae bacterium]